MLGSAILGAQVQPSNRFQLVSPLPSIEWARIDLDMASVGAAQRIAGQRGLQGRVLWIDGTANMNACSSEERIVALIERVAKTGFNTIVYDVKPIVGYTLYPSQLTERLPRWKGQSMPVDFDPLAVLLREGKRRGLSVLVALNAFSEGHSFAKRDEKLPNSQFGHPGWGYGKRELQTWQYVARPTLTISSGSAIAVDPKLNSSDKGSLIRVFDRVPVDTGQIEWSVVVDAFGRVLRSGPGVQAVADGQALWVGQGEGAQTLRGVGGWLRVGSEATFAPIEDNQTQIPLMMNPHHPQVQERALAFLREVATNYAVDGILYDDRLRFGGLNADFSELTRRQFEERVGKPVQWPDDVFRFTYGPKLEVGIRPGPLFDAWLTFRADAMRNWVERARGEVRNARSSVRFGIYAGSWYGDYVRYGANYGSTDLEAGFPFLRRAYQATGFAGKLDLLITGCYYPVPTIFDALQLDRPPGRTVEAAGILSNRVARDRTWTYAGIMLSDYAGRPDALERALQAAVATTQGVMVFDLSHDIDTWWPTLERAFKKPARPPHMDQSAFEAMYTLRSCWEKNGVKDPPFPLFEGAPGAGF